jgi:hypothetical protein
LASAVVSLLVTRADASLANAGRDAASSVYLQLHSSVAPVYFEGHWGFQFYMQKLGAKPADLHNDVFHSGDVLVIPENTTNSFGPPPGFGLSGTILEFPLPRPFTTMSQPLGAGFYASVWGPLPFAMGPVPPERYYLARLLPWHNRGAEPATSPKP